MDFSYADVSDNPDDSGSGMSSKSEHLLRMILRMPIVKY